MIFKIMRWSGGAPPGTGGAGSLPVIDDQPSRNPFLNAFVGTDRHPTKIAEPTVRLQPLISGLAFPLHFQKCD
jgi:hypothetical protein